MENQGWIKLHRQLQDNEIWLKDKFSSGQAWADLLLMASWKPTTVMMDWKSIHLKPGEFITSQLKLAQRWKWGRERIALYLRSLCARNMLTLKPGNRYSIITICNWELYQESPAPDHTTDHTTEQATPIQLTKHNQEGKEVKNKDINTPASGEICKPKTKPKRTRNPELEQLATFLGTLNGDKPNFPFAQLLLNEWGSLKPLKCAKAAYERTVKNIHNRGETVADPKALFLDHLNPAKIARYYTTEEEKAGYYPAKIREKI